jgi:thioredoxin-related protein
MNKTLHILFTAIAILCGCQSALFNDTQVFKVNDIRVDGAELGEWTHDWDAAVASAKKNGKPIFVNFTGSDWCGWCKLLKSRVFSQSEWSSWAKSNIYLVHIDFPNDEALVPEKYRERNQKLAQQYNVGGYPTCLLLDPTTLKPLGEFGASRDVTAKAFVEKVAAAMPDAKKAQKTESAPNQEQANPSEEKTSEISEKLPFDKFPTEGRIAWFDFSEGNADKAHPGRSFNCENVPIENGAMHFNGNYIYNGENNGCHAQLDVPELRYDRFTVAVSFRPQVEKYSRPLFVFGGWCFDIWLLSDGWAKVYFNSWKSLWPHGDGGFDLPEKVHLDAWNWIVVSFDAASRRLSIVLNGRLLPDIALPLDLVFGLTREGRQGNRNVMFTYFSQGEVFKGDVSGFLLFDHALTNKELNAIADIPGAKQNSVNEVSNAPTASWKYPLDAESIARWKSSLDRNCATPWKFSPDKEGAAFYWNGIVSDGSVTLDARLVDGAVSVTFPTNLSVPSGVLDLRKPILDADGVVLPLVGIGTEEDHFHVGYGDIANVSEVRLPETIRFFGPGAFENFTSLEINCPDSVLMIGSGAFMGCRGLRRLRLGRGVASFSSDRVFLDCEALESIEMDSENRHYKTVNGAVLTADGKQLVAFPPGYKGSFAIPDGVEEIPDFTFVRCNNLNQIFVPSSVKKIRHRAFANCPILEKIEFKVPSNVEYIPTGAFAGCRSLTQFSVPASVKEIETTAFKDCPALESIETDSENRHYKTVNGAVLTADGKRLVAFPSGYKGSFTVPPGVVEIPVQAFEGCRSLTQVSVPPSVKRIGGAAFADCSALERIDFIAPAGVEEIPYRAFAGCSSLTLFTVPSSVKKIGDYAFAGCSKLEMIEFENRLFKLDDKVFGGMTHRPKTNLTNE